MTGPARTYGTLAWALTPPGGEPAALRALGLPEPEAHALGAEHVLLFGRAGPTRVSPYEGTYRGTAIHEVLASYATAGYRLDPDFRDRPDHACAELAIMGGIAEDEERAREQGDAQTLRCARHVARSFFLTRLWPWLPAFFEALSAAETCPHYSALGRIAIPFLRSEGDRAGASSPPTPRPAPPSESSCRACGKPLGFPLPDRMKSRPDRGPVCAQCRIRADLRRLKT